MPDPLQKVQAGDGIAVQAATWNLFIDAAQFARRRKTGAGAVKQPMPIAAWVWVKNASGSDLAAGDVLYADGPGITYAVNSSYRNVVLLNGAAVPASPKQWRGVVLLEAIRNGWSGKAAIAGVVPAKVYVNSTADTLAYFVAGQTTMQTNKEVGFQLLDMPTSAGAGWGYVMLGCEYDLKPMTIRGEATAEVTGNASFSIDTVTVLQPRGAPAISNSVTVYNPHQFDIPNNGKVTAEWNEAANHYDATQGDCPT